MKDNESYVEEPQAAYAAKTVSIHEAKTNFSKLVKRAEAGETIYIGAYGKPTVAMISSEAVPKKRPVNEAFGCMKGHCELPDNPVSWTDEEIYQMFYASFMTWEEFVNS
ncbi:MAG: type II toxin-antitoxin system prevent-host-death family antitoxin [Treponema sp.]|nr:type II toxin-antitoxin system prevent-host-death family antitoxin [Treponema sp.]